MSDYLFISDAAKEVKVESHVLRYWEEELHLPIKRNELGHRYYTEEDVERFKQIKNMKERGLQLKAIKMILKDGKLDVLSMEETGTDRTARRNRAEAGSGIELPNAKAEDADMFQSHSPMEPELSEAEMSDTRGVQPASPQAGMAKARETQSRMPRSGGMWSGMSGSEGGQSRMPRAGGMQAGMGSEGGQTRMSRAGGMQAGMGSERGQTRMPQTARGAQSRTAQAGMQGIAGVHPGMSEAGRMPAGELEESGGMAIDIISTKEKEPVIQESREDKSRRLQWLLQQLIRQTLQENNIELCREIRDSVVKELDYQFRMQEEREDARDRMMEEMNEEHYRKMDELIRKKSRRLKKIKPDREQEKESREKKGARTDGQNKKEWKAEEHDGKSAEIDEWDKWSEGTDENMQKDEDEKEEEKKEEKKGWSLGERSKRKQEKEKQENDLPTEQAATAAKKKRRFF